MPQHAKISLYGANDALQRKALTLLNGWGAWLTANSCQGYVGEVGWPHSDVRWRAVAEAWYTRAEALGLMVTNWVTGEWIGGMQMCSYLPRQSGAGYSWDTAHTITADVLERHLGTTLIPHGVNVSGMDMGCGVTVGGVNSTYSNRMFGVEGSTFHYDPASTFTFLASRGVKVVRLPFTWERIQQTPNSALDATQAAKTLVVVQAAAAAGLKIVMDVHSYGGYHLDDGTNGIRRVIGSAEIPVTYFQDLWTRLVGYFGGEPAIIAWGLMNEPADMHVTESVGATMWQTASQAAVTAIRATGDTRKITVAGYQYSGMLYWSIYHPTAWITDPANNILYEAHHYFNSNSSGVYNDYDTELAATVAQGY